MNVLWPLEKIFDEIRAEYQTEYVEVDLEKEKIRKRLLSDLFEKADKYFSLVQDKKAKKPTKKKV